MRQFSRFVFIVGLGGGVLLAAGAAGAFSEKAPPFAALDRADMTARWAGYSPIPGGITLETKAEALRPVRSTFVEARQVRKLIDTLDGALDCQTVETTILPNETAAPPRSQGSRRPDLNGFLRTLQLQRAVETSA